MNKSLLVPFCKYWKKYPQSEFKVEWSQSWTYTMQYNKEDFLLQLFRQKNRNELVSVFTLQGKIEVSINDWLEFLVKRA